MSELFKMDMPVEQVKLTQIYKSESLDDYAVKTLSADKISKVYGEVKFEGLYEDRPYTFTSLVTSIDGRIAFTDAPQGPLVAKENKYDQGGALADWWILNMLRSLADGIMIGARTMQAEPDFTGHIFDKDLEDSRISSGAVDVPYNIITSLDGTDIPYDHLLFNTPEIPIMISTSGAGLEYVKQNIKNEYAVFGPYNSIEDLPASFDTVDRGKVIVIATGQGMPNTRVAMCILKRMGIDKLLVETPSYAHILTGEGLMDEMFLNYSCILIGGKALTIGQFGKEFTSKSHPHTRMLSIHSHSDHFFYFRHRLIYS